MDGGVDISGYLTLLLYLIGLGIALSLIYSIAELFSIDRVLKTVRGRKSFIFIGKEFHFGRLHIPPRGKGGFEVFYDESNIVNPETMLAFLIENYRETGNQKFLQEAEKIAEILKEKKRLPQDFDVRNIEVNSWSPPSLVSRKVYPNELGNIGAIIMFTDTMSEEERRKRWRELASLYHPSIVKRVSRRLYNTLAYVKDKITASLSTTTSAFMATLPADLRKAVEETQKKAIGGVGAVYDPLLENSIGRLVTVKVSDIDGETKLYQGVLREYSDKYIAVYDVDYRLQMETFFDGEDEVGGYPKPVFSLFGAVLDLGSHISIRLNSMDNEILLKNKYSRYIKVEKIIVNGQEHKVNKVLKPGEEIEIKVDAGEKPKIKVEYEVALESDIIWPRSKAVVIGLGDYPPGMLERILKFT